MVDHKRELADRIRRLKITREIQDQAVGESVWAYQTLAAALAASGHLQGPVHLERFAKHLGVQTIEKVPLASRGSISVGDTQGEGFTIQLNNELDSTDTRFTLAHELAHLVLEHGRASASALRGSAIARRTSSERRLEDLCDACATEMLLPREWVQDRVSGLDEAGVLGRIKQIAEETDLRLDYTIARVDSVQGGRWRGMWVDRRQGVLSVRRSVPPWSESLLLDMIIEEHADGPIAKCLSSGEISSGTILLGVGTPVAQTTACMPMSSERVLCLVRRKEDYKRRNLRTREES